MPHNIVKTPEMSREPSQHSMNTPVAPSGEFPTRKTPPSKVSPTRPDLSPMKVGFQPAHKTIAESMTIANPHATEVDPVPNIKLVQKTVVTTTTVTFESASSAEASASEPSTSKASTTRTVKEAEAELVEKPEEKPVEEEALDSHKFTSPELIVRVNKWHPEQRKREISVSSVESDTFDMKNAKLEDQYSLADLEGDADEIARNANSRKSAVKKEKARLAKAEKAARAAEKAAEKAALKAARRAAAAGGPSSSAQNAGEQDDDERSGTSRIWCFC